MGSHRKGARDAEKFTSRPLPLAARAHGGRGGGSFLLVAERATRRNVLSHCVAVGSRVCQGLLGTQAGFPAQENPPAKQAKNFDTL